MTIDFNNLTLISVDRGNEFIRITDLQDSITRTMKLRGSESPKLPNVIDITNQSDTFNYYAIGSDRKLYLINPSNTPYQLQHKSLIPTLFKLHPIHRWIGLKLSRQATTYS